MMSSPDAAFAAARAAVPDGMSRQELMSHIGALRAVRAWVDAAEVRATRRGRELEAAGHAGSPTATIADAGGRSAREARAVAEREIVCEQMPGLEAALRAGTVSSGHVDAVALAARRLDDVGRAELLRLGAAIVTEASTSSVDAFEKSVRDLAKHITATRMGSTDADELEAQRKMSAVERWVDRTTGMHMTKLALDPIRDVTMWTAVNAQLRSDRSVDGNAKKAWAQLQVDAFINAVSSVAGSGGSGERGGGASRTSVRPEISVLIDATRLFAVGAGAGLCETDGGVDLPVSTVRRMCCDADIIPVVLGGDREVLDVGRARRTASRAQRRALAAMHRTCAHPDCSMSFDACRIHHVRFWWEHGGRSDLDNLVPLCERHHHLVHEGGWTLAMTPDRVATWRRPDDSVHWVGSTVDRVGPVKAIANAPASSTAGTRPMLC